MMEGQKSSKIVGHHLWMIPKGKTIKSQLLKKIWVEISEFWIQVVLLKGIQDKNSVA